MNKLIRVINKPSLWKRLPIYHVKPAIFTLSSRRFSKCFTTTGSQTPTDQIVNTLQDGHGITTTPQSVSVKAAAKQMMDAQIGALIVTEDGNPNRMVGVVTERDCMRSVADLNDLNSTIVADIMTGQNNIVTAKINISSDDCFKIMLINNIRHLPLVDDDYIVCRVLSIKDVAAAMISENDRKVHEKEEEAEFWKWRAACLDDDPSLEH